MQTFGDNWMVIGLMMSAAFAMGMTLLLLNWVVAPAKPNPTKLAPYESGVPDVTPVKPRYTPRFYLVAMLFVIFDVEIIFLFAWASIYDRLGWYGVAAILIFTFFVAETLAYVWKRGALD